MIRVARNAAGNCLIFHGQSNPVYFNACLTAEVVDTDYVSIRNDIATGTGDPVYEYYRIHFSEWQHEDFSTFSDAASAVEYINSIGNVTDAVGTGTTFGPEETLDFVLDETNTSILLDNGDHHGVNGLKAVEKANGRVGIETMLGGVEWYELDHTGVTINGTSAGNTLSSVVNELNALFTVSALGGGIVPAPVYTMDGGTDIVWNSSETVDPIGDGLHGSGSTGTFYHGPRVWTTETIDEPGEYFTFEAKNVVAGGGPLLGIGLYSVGNGDLAEVTDDSLSNSGHHGYFFSTWLYNYSGYTAPWTTYGSASTLSYGPGWNGATSSQFRYSDAHASFRDNGTALFKCGITDAGFVGIWYYDVEVAGIDGAHGARSNDWILLARSGTPLPAGQYGLMVKICTTSGQIMSEPQRFATDPVAPTLYYRYIESPDGVFHYPLFSTTEEANYIDTQNGGGGTSSAQIFIDDGTNTTWYAPTTGYTNNGTSAPTDTTDITWTGIETLADSQFVPSAFSGSDLTVNEGVAVNLQVSPMDVSYTTTVTGLPTGLVFAGSIIQGSAPAVTGDNVANPSDTYTITVTRSNAFGSSVGTFDIIVMNLTAPSVAISGFTLVSGTTPLVDPDTLDDQSAVTLDNTIDDGKRFIIPQVWVESYVLPALTATGDHVILGIQKSSADLITSVGGIAINYDDFEAYIQWDYAGTASHISTISTSGSAQSLTVNSLTDSYYDYAFEVDGTDVHVIACNVSDINTQPGVNDGGTFGRVASMTLSGAPHELTLASVNTSMDFAEGTITEIDTPAPVATNLTPWTKALDFSGSSERGEMVSTSTVFNPMMMAGTSQTVAANGGLTSGHPWATACVFKIDGHNSNQHIWNVGEGAGSTDDNIALRVDSSGALFFEWGRDGARNSYLVATNLGSAAWYGLTVAHKGMRFSGADATNANLESVFDIDLWYNSGGNWIQNPNTPPGTRTWTATGGRMDRSVTGSLTIGGRGTNRSFHGQVASFVTTTLKVGDNLPSNAELTEMLTDPLGWMETYKEGNTFRRSYYTSETNWDTANLSDRASGTQIYLMGDGTNDSYSNMIRNQVAPTDQNYTKLNLISMVSSDIQTVSIPGLS